VIYYQAAPIGNSGNNQRQQGGGKGGGQGAQIFQQRVANDGGQQQFVPQNGGGNLKGNSKGKQGGGKRGNLAEIRLVNNDGVVFPTPLPVGFCWNFIRTGNSCVDAVNGVCAAGREQWPQIWSHMRRAEAPPHGQQNNQAPANPPPQPQAAIQNQQPQNNPQ